MLAKDDAHRKLRDMYRHRGAVPLPELLDVLQTHSRMSVFRRLREVGYMSSYTHAGRYYTLADLPKFDENGLWFVREVGFSRAGTLKQTVLVLVEQSSAGRTHAELQALLHVRVHNTLLQLVRQQRIGRQLFEGVHVYVSADEARAAEQLAGRRTLACASAEAERPLTAEETVEVLLEALRSVPEIPAPAVVSERLAARGLQLRQREVEKVFAAYGLVPGKKTPPT
jgi:hypothetical protein